MRNSCILFPQEEPTHSCKTHGCNDVLDPNYTPGSEPEEQELGTSVATTTFLDANLLHDFITGRSVTAVLHFFNLTPGDWYSKRQATVENATYGSEFVAAKTATEQIVDIRQTLRYLGVPIKSKAYMFGDNKSVGDQLYGSLLPSK